jgi:hypothetical protein
LNKIKTTQAKVIVNQIVIPKLVVNISFHERLKTFKRVWAKIKETLVIVICPIGKNHARNSFKEERY